MSREKVYALLREHPGEFFSREEISRRLGVSRASLYRAFDALEKSGLILRRGKTILVPSPSALESAL